MNKNLRKSIITILNKGYSTTAKADYIAFKISEYNPNQDYNIIKEDILRIILISNFDNKRILSILNNFVGLK